MTKDIITMVANTAAGVGSFLFVTLENVNVLIGILVGCATVVYLACKIIEVIRKLRK